VLPLLEAEANRLNTEANKLKKTAQDKGRESSRESSAVLERSKNMRQQVVQRQQQLYSGSI